MWFSKKDPLKDLQKEYESLQKEAMELQRKGKIPEFARKTAEAEVVLKKLEELEKSAS
jgi:hypothetical protein